MRIITFIILAVVSQLSVASNCVVLLHGLARTDLAMKPIENTLEKQGYVVANIKYPSRENDIATLANLAVKQGIDECKKHKAEQINFVTHSLGGILLRQYFANNSAELVYRVVMLGPPNNGSEVVDALNQTPGYEWLNGPAGMQLGTGKNGIPANLGPLNFEAGIIAGTQSINVILSTYLPNPDDGKVSVQSAKVDGMCGFITMPATHAMMMRDKGVLEQIGQYLKTGKFTVTSALDLNCGFLKAQ